jgi:hypothetical protein
MIKYTEDELKLKDIQAECEDCYNPHRDKNPNDPAFPCPCNAFDNKTEKRLDDIGQLFDFLQGIVDLCDKHKEIDVNEGIELADILLFSIDIEGVKKLLKGDYFKGVI